MKRLLLLLAWGLLSADVARGQPAPPATPPGTLERFERQLEQLQRDTRQRIDASLPADERALIDYGAYYTFSYLSLDDPAGNNHVLRRHELVGYGRLNFDGAHELFIRGRAAFNDFNKGDAFDGRGDDWESPFIERAHYRFDLRRAMEAYEGKNIDWNITFQGGRQLVTWANGLTLSEVVDGGIVSAAYGPFTLEMLAGVTYDDVTDFDTTRPDFRNDTHRGLFGAMLSVPTGPSSRLFAYGLAQQDFNGAEESSAGGVATRFDYNSYYIGLGADGAISDNLLFAVEFVYEGGSTLSNSFNPADGSQFTQQRDDIQALAADVRFDYVFTDPGRSRLTAELIVASGDPDRLVTNTTLGGNRAGTKDHAFNGLGLLNTGLAFAPAVSNVIVGRLGATTFPLPTQTPFRRLQLGLDVLAFGKTQEDAPIDEPTIDKRYLGMEVDLYLNWQISSDVTLAVRYGVFFPGAAIDGDSSARNFIFVGVTYAF